MKYYTFVFPGKHGQHVQETWSVKQILDVYFPYWTSKMIEAGRGDMVDENLCIDDWIILHWAERSDQFGNKLTSDDV